MSSAVLLPQQVESHIEPGTRRKYSFTPAMDEEIRRAYHLYVEYNSRKSIGACARRLGLPRWMVTRRGAVLGLARVKEPVWSPEEVALLERWGHLTDAVIQRKLKSAGYQRSVNAIHLKLKRLRIKGNLDGYSAYSLATAFGVDPHKITNWVRREMLRATQRGTERTERQGGDTYWITHKAVREFVLAYPDEVDVRKVEKWWFLDLITDGKICR